jgi:bifunctional non-homologous end joining protein LigD
MSLLRKRSRRSVPGLIEPCQPSPSPRPPEGPEWLHEIKHDGFRIMARRDGADIRLITRGGHDWSSRFSAVVEAVNRLRARSFLIDGEVVVCRPDGVSCFSMLRSRRHDAHAFLYAFDLLELNGEDVRRVPIEGRKLMLSDLIKGARYGLRLNEHMDGANAALIFRHACQMGLEGIVSKRLGSSYRSGRSLDWRKTKNPLSEAVRRESEEDWGR